jgi:hypothetical protein
MLEVFVVVMMRYSIAKRLIYVNFLAVRSSLSGAEKSCAIIGGRLQLLLGLITQDAQRARQAARRRNSMRSTVCLITIILVCLSASVAFAAPKLQVNNPKYDFGEVLQGGKVRHVFEFVNEGDEALHIDRVRSSCGCTAVLVTEKNIPPKGRGEIKANFDSTRFRGAISKTIYLYSNDPAHPVMELHIKGKVLEAVAIKPAQINFGKVPAEKVVTSTVVLRNQGGKKIILGKPHSTAAELVVKMPETSFVDGDEVTLELQYTPKPGQVRFSGYVLVPVKGVPKKELRIPVYATISN